MNNILKEIIEKNSYLTAEAVFNLADDDGITITISDLKRLEDRNWTDSDMKSFAKFATKSRETTYDEDLAEWIKSKEVNP